MAVDTGLYSFAEHLIGPLHRYRSDVKHSSEFIFMFCSNRVQHEMTKNGWFNDGHRDHIESWIQARSYLRPIHTRHMNVLPITIKWKWSDGNTASLARLETNANGKMKKIVRCYCNNPSINCCSSATPMRHKKRSKTKNFAHLNQLLIQLHCIYWPASVSISVFFSVIFPTLFHLYGESFAVLMAVTGWLCAYLPYI